MQGSLNEPVSAVLRLADRRLRSVAPTEVHEMCDITRYAAAALAPVDAFYIGLYQGDNRVEIPYAFSDGIDRGPDTMRYSQTALAHWLRASGKTYRYSDDGGRLAHGGRQLGDSERSRDVTATAMLDSDGRNVLGIMNAQSYQSDVFDDEFVSALEWLARALTFSLGLGTHRSARAELYRELPELDSSLMNSPAELLHVANERLQSIVERIDEMSSRLSDGPPELRRDLADLRLLCRRSGAEIAMMAVRTPDASEREQGLNLTAREREIAELIARESLTNAGIARRLSISEKTVKAHVSAVLRKLNIRQRAELGWILAGSKPVNRGA